MAHFALIWKARAVERYRRKYENERMNSILLHKMAPENSLIQKFRDYRYGIKKSMSKMLHKWFPEESKVSIFIRNLKKDDSLANSILRSCLGFAGGAMLTYLCFLFFIYQLQISLMSATIVSSVLGILLSLGMAYSWRARCLVFLLFPQFFSRVGRFTITCYALVLILTGPATNSLKNSEVLTESMACGQIHLKETLRQINLYESKPLYTVKDTLEAMAKNIKKVSHEIQDNYANFIELAASIVDSIEAGFFWLHTVVDESNKKVGSPYDRCLTILRNALDNNSSQSLNVRNNLAIDSCASVKDTKGFFVFMDYFKTTFVKHAMSNINTFAKHLKAMFNVSINVHHAFSFSSANVTSKQVEAGIITEIRSRADPLLTWLSWSSCTTSLFLCLIVFGAQHYQHMYETRCRFDNGYITKEVRELDLKRMRQGRETILPLNRREKSRYVNTISFRLIDSERNSLNRSTLFTAVTTFKLLIHIVADYSLYWVLTTIRYHGERETTLVADDGGTAVTGNGPVAGVLRAVTGALRQPVLSRTESMRHCLPKPHAPNFQRYAQIGVLIILLWFFALFEPYGLRLRHHVMNHYRPERARTRAVWLYNHILRTRRGFLKFARRKLHKEYKYSGEYSQTVQSLLNRWIPWCCLRKLLGCEKEIVCVLCSTTEKAHQSDTKLVRCETTNCPGIFCKQCYSDIGQLCTICLSPADYGDYSDVSLEKGTTDDDSDDDGDDDDFDSADLFYSETNENEFQMITDTESSALFRPRKQGVGHRSWSRNRLKNIAEKDSEVRHEYNMSKKSVQLIQRDHRRVIAKIKKQYEPAQPYVSEETDLKGISLSVKDLKRFDITSMGIKINMTSNRIRTLKTVPRKYTKHVFQNMKHYDFSIKKLIKVIARKESNGFSNKRLQTLINRKQNVFETKRIVTKTVATFRKRHFIFGQMLTKIWSKLLRIKYKNRDYEDIEKVSKIQHEINFDNKEALPDLKHSKYEKVENNSIIFKQVPTTDSINETATMNPSDNTKPGNSLLSTARRVCNSMKENGGVHNEYDKTGCGFPTKINYVNEKTKRGYLFDMKSSQADLMEYRNNIMKLTETEVEFKKQNCQTIVIPFAFTQKQNLQTVDQLNNNHCKMRKRKLSKTRQTNEKINMAHFMTN